MKYWIVTLPREDLEHCMRIGVLGFNSKQRLGSIEDGDRILCCATREKPWKIIGIGTVSAPLYIDDKPVFKNPGGYWYRVNFKAELFLKENEIDFQERVGALSFVKNLVYWPVYFKGGIKELNLEDWNQLSSKIPEENL
jgi:hypothetical protein